MLIDFDNYLLEAVEHNIDTETTIHPSIIHKSTKGHKESFDTIAKVVYGNSFELTDKDTSEHLKPMDLSKMIKNGDIVEKYAKEFGFQFRYFTSDPDKVRTLEDGTKVEIRPANIKKFGYDSGVIWVYDPFDEHGGFNDSIYTKVWRQVHELAHAISEDFMQKKYGYSKRFGAMSFDMNNPYDKTDKRVYKGLTLIQAQRALEWEDVAFRTQLKLYKDLGIKIPKEDAILDFNIAAHDVVIRLLTGDFSDPASYGILPKTNKRVSVKDALKFLENQYKANAEYKGVEADKGIDLSTWKPISNSEIQQAIDSYKKK